MSKLRKAYPYPFLLKGVVCSHVFVAHFFLGQIVHLGALKHVTYNRASFLDYHRRPMVNIL